MAEIKKALKESEYWFKAAEHTIETAGSEEAYTVAVAQAIHSIIKANDALALKYLGETAKRHDQAVQFFHRLIVENKIPQNEAAYKEIIMLAVQEKSKFDYSGTPSSKAKAKHWLADADKFLKLARKYCEK